MKEVNNLISWIPRSVLRVFGWIFCAVSSAMFVRSLWNSLGATLKCFGLIGFTVFVSYMGAIVLYVYNSGGIDHAIYAAVIVLIVNMIMYHVGFFNIR